MKDETFCKYMKELYPNGYAGLVIEFERHYRREGKKK